MLHMMHNGGREAVLYLYMSDSVVISYFQKWQMDTISVPGEDDVGAVLKSYFKHLPFLFCV